MSEKLCLGIDSFACYPAFIILVQDYSIYYTHLKKREKIKAFFIILFINANIVDINLKQISKINIFIKL